MPRRISYWFIGIIVAWVTYSLVWTWISLERFYTLRASIFDLGIYSQLSWRVYGASLSPGQMLATALNLGGPIILLPTTVGGYPTILAAQSFAIGSGAVLVYLIARCYTLSSPIAFGLGATYLLYFPVAGINFADAHCEAYLIPFFLLGVWLYLSGRFVLSFVLMLLAGAIQYPLGVFPLLFGLQVLLPRTCQSILEFRDRGRAERSTEGRLRSFLRKVANARLSSVRGREPKWYAYGLPLAATALLVGAMVTSILYEANYTVARLVHATALGVLPNLPNKFWSAFLLLAPLAFLPVLSPRWLPYCAPFFALMFYVNYWGYTYPYIVTSWYPFLVVPFLFLATIDGVAQVQQRTTWVHSLWRRLRSSTTREGSTISSPTDAPEAARPPVDRRARWRALRNATFRPPAIITGAVVVLTAVSAGYLTPYGPWNSSTSANFGFPGWGAYNATLYDELVKLGGLIPASDPSVILQNDMPGLLPRPTADGQIAPLVVGPFARVAYNLTHQLSNGSWSPIDPDYVLANPEPPPYSFFYESGSYPYNLSMEQLVTRLYDSYDYGIVGEASGMILLQHYYTGPLLYYVPYSADVSPTSLQSGTGRVTTACGESCLLVKGQTDRQVAWSGPYTFLSPGTYSISIHLGLANWTPSDRAVIEVSGGSGATPLASSPLSGLSVGSRLASDYLNYTLFVGGPTPGVEFRAVDSSFNGSLAFYGAEIREVAPPSSVFRAGNTTQDQSVYQLLGLLPARSSVLAEAALRPYFHNLTLVTLPSNGTIPSTTYELYDPAIPSACGPGGAPTICSVVNASYASGSYSIVGQVNGVTLLARSPAVLATYSANRENISTSELSVVGGSSQMFSRYSGANLTVTNQTNGGVGWYGPYVSLPPGSYSVRFDLSASNVSASNHLTLVVSSEAGQRWLVTLELNGTTFPRADEIVSIGLSFTLSSFQDGIEFTGTGVDWAGVITLSGVGLVETAPPP